MWSDSRNYLGVFFLAKELQVNSFVRRVECEQRRSFTNPFRLEIEMDCVRAWGGAASDEKRFKVQKSKTTLKRLLKPGL
jgi:hypothetical protein